MAQGLRLRFNSQHPHDGSQPSVTIAPGDPTSPLASMITMRACGTYGQNTHKIKNKIFLGKKLEAYNFCPSFRNICEIIIENLPV